MSPRFKLDSDDLKLVLFSFFVALATATLQWIGTDLIPFLQGIEAWWAAALVAILPTITVALRKLLQDTRPTREQADKVNRKAHERSRERMGQ